MTAIMIFGGCGFIGSHVVELLHRNTSNHLFVFDDISTGKLENIRHLISTKHNTRIKFELSDIRKKEHVQDAMFRFKPEVVIVLAAQASTSVGESDLHIDMETNVGGMLNVIDAAKKNGTRRIIFTSTGAVYRERLWGRLRESDVCAPKSSYGISKLAAEHYLQTLFPESVTLRLGNVYGPKQPNGLIASMIRHFKFGDDFKIRGDGKHTREYVYVEDVAEAIQCSLSGKPGTYNIGTGKRLSVNHVAGALEIIYDVPGYKWEHSKQGDPRPDACLDIHRAHEYLGWSPHISFMDGLKRTVEWWNEPKEEPVIVKVPLAYEVMI